MRGIKVSFKTLQAQVCHYELYEISVCFIELKKALFIILSQPLIYISIISAGLTFGFAFFIFARLTSGFERTIGS
ncbi:MAG: hypothetical protein ABIL46_03040 [candidate division WOR-3 bacterium]